MVAIEVKNVSKKYRIYHDKSVTLKERILFFNRTKFTEHQVLDGIDVLVKKGSTIALLGKNGSGKSTLLKLLTKIIFPDQGDIKLNGKVSSLLELGAGFHPDFSGKENIYTNASIFGLSRKEIDDRYNQIVEFSGLHEFIDNPVRTYSSGMYMRLAFSVAINVDADILLIDEILAVGDASFQKKCMDKLKELKRKGTTIVIVTHDLGAVEELCDEAIWILDGKIKNIGAPRRVIDAYRLYMDESLEREMLSETVGTSKEQSAEIHSNEESKKTEDNPNRWGNFNIEIKDVVMKNEQSEVRHLFSSGESAEIIINYKVNRETEDVVFGIGIYTANRVCCYGTNTFIERLTLNKLDRIGSIIFKIDHLNLVEGSYQIDLAVHAKDGTPYDYHINRYSFNIHSSIKDVGIFRPQHKWIIGGCHE
jgi:ABC-type polysaccharide/polyol phosphate transport system ATPase subunit